MLACRRRVAASGMILLLGLAREMKMVREMETKNMRMRQMEMEMVWIANFSRCCIARTLELLVSLFD
jgi:hypothetical protein